MVEFGDAFVARVAAVRSHRASLVQRIGDGDIAAESVPLLGRDDPAAATMKVLPLLEAIPGRKKVQTRRALGDIGVDEAALLGEVTDTQWEALPAALERHAR